jgi:hypothetical protein
VTKRAPDEETKLAAAAALAELDSLPIEPISVRVATAVRLTGIGRSTLYELISSGHI